MKTKKMFSIRWKILIPIVIIFIVGCVSISWNAISAYNEELKAVALSKAEAACSVAVHSVNGDEIALLGVGDESTDVYLSNMEEMQDVATHSNIKYMYTLHKDASGNIYYGIDTDESADKYVIGDIFDSDLTLVNQAFNGEIAKTVDIDKSDGENLLTVYEPIYGSDGTVVAVMGCDYDATHVLDTRYSIVTKLSIVLLISVLFDALLMNVLAGKTVKQITKVSDKIYDLVNNEGDLTQKLDVVTNDEAGLIATNVNNLIDYIRGVVVNIADNTTHLGLVSEEIVKNVNTAEDKVSDITSVMQQMSAAMQETSASLNQANDNVISIATSIDEIAAEATSGSEMSKQVMNEATNMYQKAVTDRDDVTRKTHEMSESVSDKIEKSKAVEQINVLAQEILAITEQTTLLSLNASIEAARAGEAGRGFAVVASEIGKLAQDSSVAAEQIRKVNENVLSAVSDLAEEAQVMLDFMKSVTLDGYDNLLTTSENYEKNVNDLNQMLLLFASQCETLKVNIDNINEVIGSVNIAVEESTKGITQITDSSVELTGGISDIAEQASTNESIAEKLSTEVNKFKYE